MHRSVAFCTYYFYCSTFQTAFDIALDNQKHTAVADDKSIFLATMFVEDYE